jgi:hypothetical protein
MKSHAFSIGGEFTCGGCKWPYAVAECVFDEYDREGCKRVEAAASK